MPDLSPKPSQMPQPPKAAALPTPRENVQALIDALPDATLPGLMPYLEFLMQQQRATAISSRPAKVVAADSMRKDMGI